MDRSKLEPFITRTRQKDRHIWPSLNMADKDISSLMSELNLHSSQQQGTRIQSLDEDETYKPNTHRRRCRGRPAPKKAYIDYTPPQQFRHPTCRTGHGRHAPSSAKSPEPPSLANVNFDYLS